MGIMEFGEKENAYHPGADEVVDAAEQPLLAVEIRQHRDDYMNKLAEEYPQYDWLSNKGYPTKKHREAIKQFGITPYHRKSYNLLGDGQLSFDFEE